ncbi:MAG: SRPBCC family protein [Pseudomonadales bacterium]
MTERSGSVFDMSLYCDATLRMDMRIEFAGKSAAEVFEIMGDPNYIPDWYLLAKTIHHHHPAVADQEASFNVEFTFFGDVFEEILHWDPPARYVYKATGQDFPIKDYYAMIEVTDDGETGLMRWTQWFDQVEGESYQKILPAMLPAINRASLDKLALLIGGTKVSMETYW